MASLRSYTPPPCARFLASSVLLLATATVLVAQEAQPRRPNIVLIYADDHAQHALSCYGSRLTTTPHIDRLARDGMRFSQSFVGNSICGPARATILTGLHSHAHGQGSNGPGFHNDLPTYAKLLQSSGYATAVVGKWHVSSPPTGFDHHAIKTGNYYNSTFRTEDGTEPSTGHVTDVITERSIAWMKEQSERDKPFAIWVSHSASHRTWMPALRHLAMFDGVTLPEPETLFDDYATRTDAIRTAQMRVSRDLFPAYDLKLSVTGKSILDNAATRLLDTMTDEQRRAWDAFFAPRNETYPGADATDAERTRWNWQRYIKNYLRTAAGLDDSVGAIRSFLETTGLTENTIVIYTSDQGFFLGDHGLYDKRFIYEESLRTPCIVSWPGVTKAGSTCDALVQNIDIAPTILSMARVPHDASMHGKDLSPLLRSETPADWRDAIYYQYRGTEPQARTSHLVAPHEGVRTDRFKLVHFEDSEAWELYDLETDPHELHNEADNEAFAEIREILERKLAQLRASYGVQ
ncbi:MAG: sulfatase [Planctomycetes bacterium]|nr:sulfatase [Planctomycetota bacterium]MCB9918555.1 sulfatase [Planctomycetota bacterium]